MQGEQVLGVPLSLVEAWANTMSQVGNATAERERCRLSGDTVKAALLDRSLLVLQGRLEGVGLAWFFANGRADDSEAQLHAAYDEYLVTHDPHETLR